MDPINYNIDVATPFQAALAGYQGGAAIRNDQAQQQQQQLALQQQQMQQKALSSLVNNPNAGADEYSRVMTMIPSLSEPLKKAWETKSTAQKDVALSNLSQWSAAIKNGRPDVASAAMRARADALDSTTGAPGQDSIALRHQADMVDAHPAFANAIYIKPMLIAHPDGKRLVDNIAAMGVEGRAADMAPATLTKANADASTAVSDATIKGAQAAVAPVTTALGNQLKQSEIDANEYKANPFGVAAGPNGTGPVLHGDDFLATLPAGLASQVKALAEGRQSFPAGAAMRNPATMQLLAAVGQYDPNFDAVNYNARNKTRASFTAGPDAGNITAINTAVGHLVSLKEAFDRLNNSSIPTYNTAANWAGDKTGNAEIQANTTAVKVKATAVANEMAKVFRSSGMSEGEIKDWKNSIDTSAPPAKSTEYINSAIELMQSRLDALGEKYTQGMGTTKKGIELLSPHARAQLQKLQGIDPSATDQSSSSTSPTRSYMRWANPGQQ